MTIRRLLCFLAFMLIIGCGKGCSPVPGQPQQLTAPPIPSTNGLEGQERTRWHHLAEGSEVYPLAWLLAIVNRDSGDPFLENPERFGLLPDPDQEPDNPYGLPVGLTAAETKDTRFLKLRMVGVNCAACHVNDIYYKGARVIRIDGAPNMFDPVLFYHELALDTEAVFTDAGKAWAFAQRLYDIYSPEERALEFGVYKLNSDTPPVLGELSDLKNSGPLEKKLASLIEKLHAAELQMPVQPLEQDLKVIPNEGLREFVTEIDPNIEKLKTMSKEEEEEWLRLREESVGAIKLGNIKSIVAEEASPTSSIAGLTQMQRAANLRAALRHFVETVRLLKQRAALLIRLSRLQNENNMVAGFGRIDAFGTARDLIFPGQNIPLDAPVSYPHIWNLNQITWFHWDANTTSLLERNVGQAIGLGAVFDRKTKVSTVLIENIEELERLAGKITPPAWPAKEFGPIDEAKKERGRKHFETNCLQCHKPLEPGGNTGDIKFLARELGTDPLRAENFAQKVNELEFNVALSDILKAIATKAGGTVKDENEWRVTRSYAARPLVAPWATAPYLHNNSVPTLYHLLLPASQRPKTFPIGHREYDPIRLGYITKGAGPPSVAFDTSLRGNSNAGHEYGLDLTEIERMELLEYLKSL
jgi:hypothetical protein